METYMLYHFDREDLFKGNVGVRDYVVKKAMNEGKGLKITWKDDYIFVPFESLNDSFTAGNFYSKYDKKQYSLVNYSWKKFKKVTEEILKGEVKLF